VVPASGIVAALVPPAVFVQNDNAAPPVAVMVMIFGELVAMEMPEPAAMVVVELESPLIAVMPDPETVAGTQLVPLYVRTWFVVGVLDETVIPCNWVALILPVPIAARVPEVFISTPLEVPWAVNSTGDAAEVPTVLTWNSGPVPVLPVVSWMRKGFVVVAPTVKVVVKLPILSERLVVGLLIPDQVLDAPPPVAVMVMIFGELVAMEMPDPATIEVVAFVRPLMAVMPLPPLWAIQEVLPEPSVEST